MDANLTGNSTKVHFVDAVLLPSVCVFETPANVCLLVATVNSVHRLVFPHPEKLHKHVSEVYMIKIMSELRIKNRSESDLHSCEVT